MVLLTEGNTREARRTASRAAQIHETQQTPVWRAFGLWTIGASHQLDGRLDLARTAFSDAHELLAANDHPLRGAMLAHRASIDALTGRVDDAVVALARARDIVAGHDEPEAAVDLLGGFVDVTHGDAETAGARLDRWAMQIANSMVLRFIERALRAAMAENA